jgi:hypothetical protein
MNRLFLVLAVLLIVVVGVAAAKDSHDRQYLSIQDKYKQDHPGSNFDTQVQELFPAFPASQVGQTFKTERCISCHVPDISVIGPQQAAKNLSSDFLKYEPNAQAMVKEFGLTLVHPAFVTQQLYDRFGADSFATSDGFHPYVVPGDTGPQEVKLPGPIPSFLSPSANGGRPWGLDQVGCIVCHNGSRLALDDTHAHQNLIVNPEYAFTEGARLYYQYCVACHGTQGEGKIGPPLSNQDRLGFFNEDYYYRCIEYGFTDFEHVGSVMPAWGSQASDFSYDPNRDKLKLPVNRQLTEDQIHILVQFIRHWENYATVP